MAMSCSIARAWLGCSPGTARATNRQRLQRALQRARAPCNENPTAGRARRAGPPRATNGPGEAKPKADPALLVTASAGVLATLATLAATVWREPLEDFVYGDVLYGGAAGGWGPGDVVAALLWAASVWYVSPVQLVALFFGTFERDRPSDWIMNGAGRAAGLDTEAVDYAPPGWARGLALAAALGWGVAVAAALESGLGDATWGVSSGFGAVVGAAMYEAGRPTRLSADEAVALEGAWQDFARFADVRLRRSGRCHESEVFRAFRREAAPRYRDPEALPNTTLRDMVRNWAPDSDRTRSGFVKGVSLAPRVDPFTGQASGSGQAAAAAKLAPGQQAEAPKGAAGDGTAVEVGVAAGR